MNSSYLVKTVMRNLFILALAYVLFFNLHEYLLAQRNTVLSFSLFKIYTFHFVASAVVYFLIELLATIVPSQAGFAYLGTIFIKVGIFVLLFQDLMFSEVEFIMAEKLAVVIPMFLFLFIGVFVISRLVNTK